MVSHPGWILLVPFHVPGIGSRSTVTVIRMEQLLKMDGWMMESPCNKHYMLTTRTLGARTSNKDHSWLFYDAQICTCTHFCLGIFPNVFEWCAYMYIPEDYRYPWIWTVTWSLRISTLAMFYRCWPLLDLKMSGIVEPRLLPRGNAVSLWPNG